MPRLHPDAVLDGETAHSRARLVRLPVRRTPPGLVLLVTMAAFGSARAQVSHHTQTLPESPEKTLVTIYCVACHHVERIQQSGGSEAIWDDRIRRMVRWGAAIPEEQIGSLARYLASALPRRLRPPAGQSWFANTVVSEVAVQRLQTTLRVAGVYDPARHAIVVPLEREHAALVVAGQRVHAFCMAARADSLPGKVVRVAGPAAGGYALVAMDAVPRTGVGAYLVEIVVERGDALAIPNDALIEDGDRRFVYVRDPSGNYQRRDVTVGLQADLFTAVRSGVTAGEPVVALGSFFIDAEYRMSAGTANAAPANKLL